MKDYLTKNLDTWNKRTAVHVESEMYDIPSFLKGRSSVTEIESNLLDDVRGKSILHLQCHFGQDTLSLARMGAKVVGADLSDKSIDKARELTETMQKQGDEIEAKFICCDVYDLPKYLDQQFDIVYTSFGTISWLPDMDKWAKVVSHFLRLGGEFIFAEFHPVVWMFDEDFTHPKYSYFNTEPIIDITTGTYTDRDADIQYEEVSWNHDQAEVLTALLKAGLTLEVFQEFDYSPFDCFRHTEKIGERKYRIKHFEDKIPMVYALKCRK